MGIAVATRESASIDGSLQVDCGYPDARADSGVVCWRNAEASNLNVPAVPLCPQLPEGWPSYGTSLSFWLGWRDWLVARGFILNISSTPTDNESKPGWWMPSFTTPASLPYAHRVQTGEPSRVSDERPSRQIAWAQDSMHRDVAFKLTLTGSDEYRIYRTLLNLVDTAPSDECCGVLRPVAILDTAHSFSFIAMPRWGMAGDLQQLNTIAEVTTFMRCTSRGLRMLHENRIAHRDIHETNILMNYYNPESPYETARPPADKHKGSPDIHYCLFDFDISCSFARDAPLDACRRPSRESFDGAPAYHPRDTMHGEHDYDPFAYDVGCLGNLYIIMFAALVPTIPLLAPLFDRMTTHVVAERFTAAEAADFIEHAISQVPTAVLDTVVSLSYEWECCDDPDIYWARTTPEFRARWAHLRAPGIPWPTALLTQVIRLPMGWPLVCLIRDTLRI